MKSASFERGNDPPRDLQRNVELAKRATPMGIGFYFPLGPEGDGRLGREYFFNRYRVKIQRVLGRAFV